MHKFFLILIALTLNASFVHADQEAAVVSHESVGAGKGILEASPEDGIKLSPEALKNFALKTVPLKGLGPWTIGSSARLESLEEVNLYRKRNDFYRRIDFTILKRLPGQMTITSKELKAGDEVVIDGVGFLRLAELAAFGGAPESHSH